MQPRRGGWAEWLDRKPSSALKTPLSQRPGERIEPSERVYNLWFQASTSRPTARCSVASYDPRGQAVIYDGRTILLARRLVRAASAT